MSLFDYYIIQQLRHSAVGWTDWNYALDLNGGPNWANMGADSPIIVDSDKQVFYKQPMFYAMAHFSKFFVTDSQVIGSEVRGGMKKSCTNIKGVTIVSAIHPDNNVVVVTILNKYV